jgi:2,3-bisphosphoglycerate-dependent phosphoglycerate mutase
MGLLLLARHGESQFNAKSLWTGIWDVPLTDRGRKDAVTMAHAVKNHKPSVAFTSTLSRAHDTLTIILETNHWKIPVKSDPALNERDYGDLTGMNKWVVEEKYGRDQFNKWRRGWDEPVPKGETLKQVFRRVIPYFDSHILPDLKRGKTVLVVAHGNTLRALIKGLDDLSDAEVTGLEMPFGEILEYTFDKTGAITHKHILHLDISAPPA